jgi:hypothetical protein
MGFRSVCYCNKCPVIAVFCFSWKLKNKVNTVKQKHTFCKILYAVPFGDGQHRSTCININNASFN